MTSDDPSGSFKSHSNYLRALATLAGYRKWPPIKRAEVLGAQRDRVLASGTLQDARQGSPDMAGVRKSLANAWGTELLLALSSEYASEDELARIANNWGTVQAYYVAYHAFQAYLLSNGEPRPKSHAKTQTMFADRWCSRPVDLPPWSFGAGDGTFDNAPQGRVIDLNLHSWTACDETNCWDIAGAALKSTRDDAIREAEAAQRQRKRTAARKAWLAEDQLRVAAGKKSRPPPDPFPRKNLTKGEKAAIGQKTRRYTALDYLYRLRVKSNYVDSTMFTEGPTDENSSKQVHRDLSRLASSVLLMHELHVRERVGLPAMTKLVDEWIAGSMPRDLTLGIATRRDQILDP